MGKKNSTSSGSGRDRHGSDRHLGFSRSFELDQLSNDKISQLLGEQENELETPEWDDVGNFLNHQINTIIKRLIMAD